MVGAEAGQEIWDDVQSRLDALQDSGLDKIAWPEGCGEIDIIEEAVFSDAPYYTNGAFFFKALENRIGAQALDAALATFLARYMGEAVGVQDLLDTIEAETGFDATACALAWLRSEDLPAEDTCPER